MAPSASAQPAPGPPPGEPGPPLPAPAGVVPSGPPGVLETPDGWHLTVTGSDESHLPVAPLTTAITSREYLVSGTYSAEITGAGSTQLTGGTLEAGQQIGCGIINEEYEMSPNGSMTPSINVPLVGAPMFSFGASLEGKVYLSPGATNTVSIEKKSFKGTSSRISVNGVRVRVDQCAGQSFIRSYATLVSSTDNTDDVVTYLGVTTAV
ncbi:MspA family porin [Mycolicibacterium xanthum]|uniref:MspA family porin n=1 Tax=Mycolicibacterium xanthum TaxID=2796469 RepID=UPI0027E0827C|nr:MspA family porin [Mycolicibacterium xanthum]